MRNVLIILALLFAISQEGISQNSEQEILDQFFELYSTDPIQAIDYVYGTTEWIDIEGDAVKKLKSQLRQYEELVGNYHGKELLYTAQLGESFSTYIYFVKYDRQPIRFTFEFYKPTDKWILFSFKFDDSFNQDLQSIIKYEYMQSKY